MLECYYKTKGGNKSMKQVKFAYQGTQTGFFVNEFRKANISVYSLEFLEQVAKQLIHHQVLLVDLSYSMSWALDRKKILANRVKAWLHSLDSNTYASVIVFSGHNESKEIVTGVKCDDISLKMAKVDEIIDAAFHPIGVTVMSEPLEKSLEIVKSVADVADTHSVVLFTDGCLVPYKWNSAVERKKCFDVAEACKNTGVHLNAIGFGHYYDRDFLKELVDIAQNGVVVHAESMEDFEQQVREISYSSGNTAPVDLVVRTNIAGTDKVINATTATTIDGDVTNTAGIVFKTIPKGKKLYLGVMHEADVIPSVIAISSAVEIINVDDRKVVVDIEGFDDVVLALAANYSRQQAVDEAEFVLRQLGDIALADKLSNAYSFKESGEALREISMAMSDPSIRFKGGRKPADAPKPEKLSVLEVLQQLTTTDNAELLWAVNTPYKSIGKATKEVEDNITFIRNEDAIVKVSDIVIAADKLNIGVKVTIPGKSVDSVTGLFRECVTYRDRNIVHGGNLNVPFINAKLTKELFAVYNAEGILNHDVYEAGRTYKVDLTSLKMITKKFTKSLTPQEIADKLYDVQIMKARLWALGQVQETVVDGASPFQPSGLSFEEQQVRNALRINFKGVYEPLKTEDVISETVEVYPATFVNWGVARFPEKAKREAALDEVNSEIVAKGWKPGNDNEEIYKYVSDILTALRRKIRRKEMQVSFVRIASTVSRRSPFKWDAQEVKDKKATSKITGTNLVVGGTVTKSSVLLGTVTLVEDRWMQLIEI
jgi:hypothetical protein